MLRTTMLATATAAITAALVLTACDAPEPTSSTPAATAAPAAAEPDNEHSNETGKEAHTRMAFSISWAGLSEAERTELCTSLVVLGPERSAEEMSKGASNPNDLDWDYATVLLAQKCDDR